MKNNFHKIDEGASDRPVKHTSRQSISQKCTVSNVNILRIMASILIKFIIKKDECCNLSTGKMKQI